MYKRKLSPILLVLALCLAPPAAAADGDGGPMRWISDVWGSVLEAVGFGASAVPHPDPSGASDDLGGLPDPSGSPAQTDAEEGDPETDPAMVPHPDPNG
jgi:hypothetical protein